jgi:8-oxo-dGTP pyrophosphatase MutT (NUDIX family)
MTYEKSCGAVLFTRRGKSIRYVIVHQRRGSWGFPKGHVEAGETERETALREIYEEVGIRPRLIDGFREESRYMLPRSTIRKTVVLFLAEYENQKIHPQKEELIDAPLLSYEEALTRLPHEDTRRILTAAHLFIQGYFDKEEGEEPERPRRPRHFDRRNHPHSRKPDGEKRPAARAEPSGEAPKTERTEAASPAQSGEGREGQKKPRRPYIPWYKRKKKKKATAEGGAKPENSAQDAK